MQFDWNEANVSHIARHDITREEAEEVLRNDPIDAEASLRNGEQRRVHLGETDVSRVLFVVVTDREGTIASSLHGRLTRTNVRFTRTIRQ